MIGSWSMLIFLLLSLCPCQKPWHGAEMLILCTWGKWEAPPTWHSFFLFPKDGDFRALYAAARAVCVLKIDRQIYKKFTDSYIRHTRVGTWNYISQSQGCFSLFKHLILDNPVLPCRRSFLSICRRLQCGIVENAGFGGWCWGGGVWGCFGGCCYRVVMRGGIGGAGDEGGAVVNWRLEKIFISNFRV